MSYLFFSDYSESLPYHWIQGGGDPKRKSVEKKGLSDFIHRQTSAMHRDSFVSDRIQLDLGAGENLGQKTYFLLIWHTFKVTKAGFTYNASMIY